MSKIVHYAFVNIYLSELIKYSPLILFHIFFRYLWFKHNFVFYKK